MRAGSSPRCNQYCGRAIAAQVPIEGVLNLVLVDGVPVQDITPDLPGDGRVAEEGSDASELVLEVGFEIEVQGFAQGLAQAVVEVGPDEAGRLQHAPRQGALQGLDVVFEDVAGYISSNAGA
jgi:hypothetical protein